MDNEIMLRFFALPEGLRRAFNSILPMTRHPRKVKPIIRMAHLYPNFGRVARRISGMVTPPNDEPIMAIPAATPRRRLNQCETAASEVVVSMAPVGPPSTPRHSMKCQYLEHSASRNTITT